MTFKDRRDAARQLTQKLQEFKNTDAIVYALPRGGVVIGDEIAQNLHLPLSLVITRKVGHPSSPEYAICAVTESGKRVCNQSELTHVDTEWLDRAIEDERREAKSRREIYLEGGQPLSATEKTAIIVDDGIATGLTLEAAVQEMRNHNPQKIVVAVPVAPAEEVHRLISKVDAVVTVISDEHYRGAVGTYYDEFDQTTDEEVWKIMSRYQQK